MLLVVVMKAVWNDLLMCYLTEYDSVGMKIISVIVDYIYGFLVVDIVGSLPYNYVDVMLSW